MAVLLKLALRASCEPIVKRFIGNIHCIAMDYYEIRKIYVKNNKHFMATVTFPLQERRLARQILAKKKFPDDLIYELSYDMIIGMCYLHSKKIIHRDIKPSYVFFLSYVFIFV